MELVPLVFDSGSAHDPFHAAQDGKGIPIFAD
jgi:hypothetical protein